MSSEDHRHILILSFGKKKPGNPKAGIYFGCINMHHHHHHIIKASRRKHTSSMYLLVSHLLAKRVLLRSGFKAIEILPVHKAASHLG